MHNFELSDERTMIFDSIRKLVEDVAAPKALELDEHRQFASEGFQQVGELGLFGMLVSEASGGAGLGHLSLVVAVEELAKVCGSTARLVQMQAGVCAAALDGLETGLSLLEAVMTGEHLTAFVGPEHGVLVDSSGRVTGVAPCTTGGMEAGRVLVASRTEGEPVLLVVDTAGVTRTATGALGFRATAPADFAFEDIAGEVLARGGAAADAIARAELAASIGSAALAIGSAFGSIEHARRHAGERIAFGKPLLAQQAVGHKLVESRRRAEAARHLVYHAARLADSGDLDAARDNAFFAKLSGVEAAVYAADEAIQIHGGYGYVVEYHVERHYRDAKALEVLDGGVESLRDALIPT